MRIKSTVWFWLSAGCLAGALGTCIGLDSMAVIPNDVWVRGFIAILVMDAAHITFVRLGFAAQDREQRAARCRRIRRTHARNPEYPDREE